jgi:transposase
MRSKGSLQELEHRRRLAAERLREGYSVADVADFLGVDARSVRRWWATFRRRGPQGLTAGVIPGRPRKLSRTQEKIVLRWLADSPTEHGFATELWTAPRIAQLIAEEWDIHIHPWSVCRWLHAHGLSLQRPQRVPRERDPEVIADWLRTEWPRIKKKPIGVMRPLF